MSANLDQMRIKRLDWDSDFFGFEMGSLALDSAIDADCAAISLRGLKTSGFRLVVVNYPSRTPSMRAAVEKAGAKLVDVKVDYAAPVAISYTMPLDIETIADDVMLSELEALEALALASGERSRFRLDPGIGEKHWMRLYYAWLRNSLSGAIADAVLVHRSEGKITGFVTIKADGNRARIGLIAVDLTQRGLGIGGRLIAAVHAWAHQRGLREIAVATQQENSGACKFYAAKGFRVASETDIYHLWI